MFFSGTEMDAITNSNSLCIQTYEAGLRVGRADERNILRNLPDERTPILKNRIMGFQSGKSRSLIRCRGFQNLDKLYKFGKQKICFKVK
ncbi:hypothetical protein CEXT_421901 [Caerostris extrusa]|uniref:Uncharacterized protein n=1 Tax=Caerostris extrusa TaxID=172846 RepID=A0AAV4X4Z2_CAEEX|nr:hypothetical protein CEXT_421901 [Caerostris extrusa]